jgi:hypothetical protein
VKAVIEKRLLNYTLLPQVRTMASFQAWLGSNKTDMVGLMHMYCYTADVTSGRMSALSYNSGCNSNLITGVEITSDEGNTLKYRFRHI